MIFISGCATYSGGQVSKVLHAANQSDDENTLENQLLNANVAYEEGRLVEAERLFLAVVFKHPTLSDSWFKLGNIYFRTGRYAAAINAYEEVLNNDLEYDKAWYNLALTRRAQSVDTLERGMSNVKKTSPFYAKMKGLRDNLVYGCQNKAGER